MHLILGIVHYFFFADIADGIKTYANVLQIVAVIGQVLNFCLIS